jgi:hypothetical protein
MEIAGKSAVAARHSLADWVVGLGATCGMREIGSPPTLQLIDITT